jgi:hypothetical protein
MTARTASRPFRSLGLLLVGWILVRAVTIFSSGTFEHAMETATVAIAVKKPMPVDMKPQDRIHSTTASVAPPHRTTSRRTIHWEYSGSPFRTAASFGSFRQANYIYPQNGTGYGLSFASISTMPSSASVPGKRDVSNDNKRWSASVWLLVREDGPASLNTGGELGGSQVGARLFYTVANPIAATARISRPLARAQGGEASIGVALRHRNVGLLIERRVALDSGGRNDFSITAYGGVSEVALGHGVRLDGYAQAGMVGSDAFADGAVRVERTLATIGVARISAGGGAWGGIQPGTKRIDVGPQIVAQMPVNGSNVRISAEWRERVAGNAAPRSGPSLTIGVDF